MPSKPSKTAERDPYYRCFRFLRPQVPPLPPGRLYVGGAAGDSHSVLLRDDGWAVAFGNREYGMTTVPDLAPGEGYVAAAAGDFHTILLTSNGDAVAFGMTDYGICRVPEIPRGLRYVPLGQLWAVRPSFQRAVNLSLIHI